MPVERKDSQNRNAWFNCHGNWRCLCAPLVCLATIALNQGCSFLDDSQQTIHSSFNREPAPKAKYHNNKGLKYFAKGSFGKAETHFLKAIEYDPSFAAAHNNLGNLLFSRRDLYQAAWEFQRASELAPQSVEPLINLGLVHDEADRLDEATEYYLTALQIDPRNALALGNLIRIKVKQEDDPGEIHHLLRELVFLDTRPEWVDWAEELLATRYRFAPMPIGPYESPGEPRRDSVNPIPTPESIRNPPPTSPLSMDESLPVPIPLGQPWARPNSYPPNFTPLPIELSPQQPFEQASPTPGASNYP